MVKFTRIRTRANWNTGRGSQNSHAAGSTRYVPRWAHLKYNNDITKKQDDPRILGDVKSEYSKACRINTIYIYLYTKYVCTFPPFFIKYIACIIPQTTRLRVPNHRNPELNRNNTFQRSRGEILRGNVAPLNSKIQSNYNSKISLQSHLARINSLKNFQNAQNPGFHHLYDPTADHRSKSPNYRNFTPAHIQEEENDNFNSSEPSGRKVSNRDWSKTLGQGQRQKRNTPGGLDRARDKLNFLQACKSKEELGLNPIKFDAKPRRSTNIYGANSIAKDLKKLRKRNKKRNFQRHQKSASLVDRNLLNLYSLGKGIGVCFWISGLGCGVWSIREIIGQILGLDYKEFEIAKFLFMSSNFWEESLQFQWNLLASRRY